MFYAVNVTKLASMWKVSALWSINDRRHEPGFHYEIICEASNKETVVCSDQS